MQRDPWARTALHTSEAVLLPALPRTRTAEPAFSDRYTRAAARDDPFRPLPPEPMGQTLALSTYVRPRGSMAGRGVLRAAGVAATPLRWERPRYAPPRARLGCRSAWRRGG